MNIGIKNTSSTLPYVLLSIVCYASLWFGLGATRLWDRDEPRNARCAVEMLERNDWVVPYFNDQLRTHKPVLLYWMEMVAYQCFGENAFAARMPSALMGTLSAVGIAILASSFLGRLAGVWAAAVLATCAMMVVASRAATPDASLICASCWGVVGLVIHWKTGSTSITRWWWVGFISLGIAILAKGPVGIVLPSIVVGLWCVLQVLQQSTNSVDWPTTRQPKLSAMRLFLRVSMRAIGNVLGRLHVFAGLSLALAISAPWYIWVGLRTDGEWLHGFFWEHNVSRAVNAMEGHRGGIWYYPAAALIGLFPWSLLLIPVAAWTWRSLFPVANASEVKTFDPSEIEHKNSLRELSSLGIIWMVVYIGCFSIARTKLPSYITPCYPGVALLIGGFLSQWSLGLQKISRPMMYVGATVYALTGILLSAGLVVANQQLQIGAIRMAAIWPLILLVAGIMMFLLASSPDQRRIPAVLIGASALLMAAIFGEIAPKVDSNRNDLNAMITMNSGAKWLSLGTIEPSWVFYMRNPIEEVSAAESNRQAAVERIANHLRSTGSRLLVREDQWASHKQELEDSFGLKTSTVAHFPVFLKNRTLVVVEQDAVATAKLSKHNSSNRR
jgi:4-amino-4-deoxy-L-arabinose transferase-like glycosyltransferase